ncbi:MAG: hypothetical protein JO327_07245, partial [Nitrososphaeraceae archaeon]|nr:hypothetical protein [Nitrososphaeraceae archaeon]
IVIVAAIASMLVVGLNMIPLSQNAYASSSRHSEFKNAPQENRKSSAENNMNQQFLCYRSKCTGSNLGIQQHGQGNSATGWTDLSNNLQQNQTTMAQPQSSQSGHESDNDKKERSTPVTINVVPKLDNQNTNSVVGNTSSAADASNHNNLSNRNAQNQTQAQNACIIAGECTAGSSQTEIPRMAGMGT